jgi:hypothetical protein
MGPIRLRALRLSFPLHLSLSPHSLPPPLPRSSPDTSVSIFSPFSLEAFYHPRSFLGWSGGSLGVFGSFLSLSTDPQSFFAPTRSTSTRQKRARFSRKRRYSLSDKIWDSYVDWT